MLHARAQKGVTCIAEPKPPATCRKCCGFCCSKRPNSTFAAPDNSAIRQRQAIMPSSTASSNSSASPLIVKAAFDRNESVRRITFPSYESIDYDSFVDRLAQALSLSPGSFQVKYTDDDGDETEIRSQSCLDEAIYYFKDDDLSSQNGSENPRDKCVMRVNVQVEYRGPSLSDSESFSSSYRSGSQGRLGSQGQSDHSHSRKGGRRGHQSEEHGHRGHGRGGRSHGRRHRRSHGRSSSSSSSDSPPNHMRNFERQQSGPPPPPADWFPPFRPPHNGFGHHAPPDWGHWRIPTPYGPLPHLPFAGPPSSGDPRYGPEYSPTDTATRLNPPQTETDRGEFAQRWISEQSPTQVPPQNNDSILPRWWSRVNGVPSEILKCCGCGDQLTEVRNICQVSHIE